MTCQVAYANCPKSYAYVLADEDIKLEFRPTNEKASPSVKYSGVAKIAGHEEWLYKIKANELLFSPNPLVSTWLIKQGEKLDIHFVPRILRTPATLIAETVPFNRLRDSQNLMNRTAYIQFQEYYNILPISNDVGEIDYFPNLFITVRSPVVKIVTSGRYDDKEMFGDSLTIDFKVDQIRIQEVLPEYPNKNLCLGQLNTETREWTCANRNKPEDLYMNTLKLRTMEYEIFQPGTYAVILKPIYLPKQKQNAYTGFLKLQKFQCIAIFFLWLPLTVIIMGLLGDIIEFEIKCRDLKDDRKFLKEQVSRMEDITCDFIGQKLSEKIDEGIEYSINPIHSSQGLDIPQTRLINIELEVIEDQKLLKDVERTKLFAKIAFKNKKIVDLRNKISDLNEEEKFRANILKSEESY